MLGFERILIYFFPIAYHVSSKYSRWKPTNICIFGTFTFLFNFVLNWSDILYITHVKNGFPQEPKAQASGKDTGCSDTELGTVKLWAVERSTVQFWILLAKVHSTNASNFPFINSLKILGCATNRDVILLATLQYLLSARPSLSLLLINVCKVDLTLGRVNDLPWT